jgi:DNA invertase Pin-like site-specific DNA recombinase
MKYIAYYRVSTKRQGISGLGLEAQREAVRKYISPELIDQEFTEVETGTNKKHRPELAKAIELCKKHDATLLIAKLDRLARNVSFVSNLMDSGVKFKAVDFPEANELTIHILASIAQHEAKVISTRIKDALSVKKIQLAKEGKKLGTPENLTNEARKKGVEIVKMNARNNENNRRAKAYIVAMKDKPLRTIAKELNKAGFKTSRGKEFTAMQVSRLMKVSEAS